MVDYVYVQVCYIHFSSDVVLKLFMSAGIKKGKEEKCVINSTLYNSVYMLVPYAVYCSLTYSG